MFQHTILIGGETLRLCESGGRGRSLHVTVPIANGIARRQADLRLSRKEYCTIIHIRGETERFEKKCNTVRNYS